MKTDRSKPSPFAFAFLAALVALAGAAAPAEQLVPLRAPLPEIPDDPPAKTAARDDPEARSPGGRGVRGGFVSVQVNVDALGQNIVGDAANEPSIAIDPNDPNKIVIGWRQFDNVASNFRQAGWAYSDDGGATWTFPGVLEPGVFRSDPVLDVNSQGVFHYNSLMETFDMDVWRSLTAGQTWEPPTPAFGGDKNWMAIDRTGGMGEGHVYGTWQRFFNCCGPNIFTRSTDGAQSFEFPVTVTNSPSFGTITVGPDGTVYASGVREQQFSTFVVSRSTNARDAGATPSFSGVVVNMGGSMGFQGSPNPAGLLGQAQVVVDSSGGDTHGNVYLLSSVNPPGGDPMDVHISRSEDGGVTWSPPVRINDDASNSNWQWFGTLSVAPNGRLDVVWNDTRSSGQSTVSELFYSFSKDAGATWSQNVAVSPPFNSTVGWPNQNKIGDYYDMESDLSGASIAYSATFNGEQDVYFLRVFPDCDGNNVPDAEDLRFGTLRDANRNGIPDSCDGGMVLSEPDPGLPGINIFTVTGARPNAKIGVWRSFDPGTTQLPGCPGVNFGLDDAIPSWGALSDPTGTTVVRAKFPPDWSGETLLFQAGDAVACTVSNLVSFTVN